MLAVVEFVAQVGDGVDEAVEVAVAELGLRGGAVGGHRFGITADAADAAGKPPGKRTEHEQTGGEQKQDVLLGIDQRPSGKQEQDAEQNEEKADAEVFEIFKHGLAEWIWLRGLILSRVVFQFRCVSLSGSLKVCVIKSGWFSRLEAV